MLKILIIRTHQKKEVADLFTVLEYLQITKNRNQMLKMKVAVILFVMMMLPAMHSTGISQTKHVNYGSLQMKPKEMEMMKGAI